MIERDEAIEEVLDRAKLAEDFWTKGMQKRDSSTAQQMMRLPPRSKRTSLLRLKLTTVSLHATRGSRSTKQL